MDSHDFAYIGGLFDGEGSVIVTMQRRNYGRGLYFGISAQIAMTDKATVQLLQDEWPAHMSVRIRNGGAEGKNYRDLWRWHIERKKCATFLCEVQPYVRLKAEQVRLALELDAMMGPGRKTDDEYDRMVQIKDRVKELNRRGVA